MLQRFVDQPHNFTTQAPPTNIPQVPQIPRQITRITSSPAAQAPHTNALSTPHAAQRITRATSPRARITRTNVALAPYALQQGTRAADPSPNSSSYSFTVPPPSHHALPVTLSTSDVAAQSLLNHDPTDYVHQNNYTWTPAPRPIISHASRTPRVRPNPYEEGHYTLVGNEHNMLGRPAVTPGERSHSSSPRSTTLRVVGFTSLPWSTSVPMRPDSPADVQSITMNLGWAMITRKAIAWRTYH
jgi:hypothetical protein